MNKDTIYRQAAIDAVTDELDMIDHVPQWVFDRLEKRLRQLPPTQSEQNTCGYWDNESEYCALSRPSAQLEERFEFGKWYDFERGYVLETTVHSFRILKDVEASSNE